MLGNELLDFGKWKNFMFDQWLAICWDIIEIMATIHFSKIAQMFATLRNLSICISVNEWTLNSLRTCCYFGLHSWLMDKVTKFSPWTFSICFQNYRSEDHVIRSFKNLNSRELNASTTKKAFTNSFFDFSTNLFHFFSPQLFLKISTSTTIIKTWTVPLPRQNKYR